MKLLRWEFEKICSIEPEREASGDVRVDYAHLRFSNPQDLPLNRFGGGPFCRFSLSTPDTRAGVYAFVVAGKLQYVGQCQSLTEHINSGYGSIAPRDCFIGRQSTNCRVNREVCRASISGESIELFFLETSQRFAVEEAIISLLRPPWNRHLPRSHRA